MCQGYIWKVVFCVKRDRWAWYGFWMLTMSKEGNNSGLENSSDEDRDGGSEPIGRKGICSVVHGGKLYLLGGYPFPHPVEVDVFDFKSCRWSVAKTTNFGELRAGSCCARIRDSVFVFGGWFNGARYANLQELDFLTLTWKKIKVANSEHGPMCKDKAGMVDYGEEMLCVMGGFGYPAAEAYSGGGGAEVSGFQKGSKYHMESEHGLGGYWTNELHLFHIPSGVWLSPELSGSRPPPCAAFTFTRVDRHRVVLFGGRQLEERVDQLYILDMLAWHWTGPVVPSGVWPLERSVHSACSLVDPTAAILSSQNCSQPRQHVSHEWLPFNVPDLLQEEEEEEEEESSDEGVEPKVLVAWGMDSNAEVVDDMWILHVSTLTWEKVSLPDSAGPPRIWGAMGVHHPATHEAIVIATGGTKNKLNVGFVDRSTLLHFGLQTSLYRQCLLYLADHLMDFSSLKSLLPSPVQEKLQQTVQELNNKRKHFTYMCHL